MGLTTATARTLRAPLDAGSGRAGLVASRLGAAIRLGLLLDGERLPSETTLAHELGVSTVTLREALTSLREQGLIVTRRGRGGGTIVRAPADVDEPLRRFSLHDLRDLGDQRAATAGAAAHLAAQRALPEEIRQLEEQVHRLQAAASGSERRRADTELAIAIAAAAQSPLLTREEERLRAQVGDLLGIGVDDRDHDRAVRRRRQLVAAIGGRRAGRARALAERLVAAETERLLRLRLRIASAPAPGADPEAALDELASELGRVYDELGELAARFAARIDVAGGGLRREQLEALRPTMFSVLERHADLVSGAGVITAPDLLLDAPRWIEWWWRGRRGIPEALRVNLDPLAPDSYDYTLTDWYAGPERTLAPRMAGPYVDYVCTNQYAITLSTPVRLAAGGFAGVAAADIPVSNIERRVLPALSLLRRPAALVSPGGRVIVSNVPAVVTGQRLEDASDVVLLRLEGASVHRPASLR